MKSATIDTKKLVPSIQVKLYNSEGGGLLEGCGLSYGVERKGAQGTFFSSINISRRQAHSQLLPLGDRLGPWRRKVCCPSLHIRSLYGYT